jgi:NADH:ubiquinone reductase (non-electrogenic)
VFKAFRDADLETKSVAMYKEVGVGDRMGTLSREQFAELLQKIDSGLRALPATAQVARQQGEYLAAALRQADGNVAGERPPLRFT